MLVQTSELRAPTFESYFQISYMLESNQAKVSVTVSLLLVSVLENVFHAEHFYMFCLVLWS